MIVPGIKKYIIGDMPSYPLRYGRFSRKGDNESWKNINKETEDFMLREANNIIVGIFFMFALALYFFRLYLVKL